MINKKMTILAINCNISSGGGKIMLEIADESRKKGFNYYTISPYKKNRVNILNHFFIVSKPKQVINRVISEFVGDDSALLFNGIKEFASIVDKINPDLIHIHGLHGWFINYLSLIEYIKTLNIPVVWTQHDCWAFTGKCPYFERNNCKRWKNHCGSCPQLFSYPKSFFFDKTTKMLEKKKKSFCGLDNVVFVPVSKWLMSNLKESFVSKCRIELIENWVDLSIFYPRESSIRNRFGLENKRIILGVASSWSERKGFRDFINISKLLNPKKYQIVLIGIDDSKICDCKDANIIGISRTNNQDELAEWYSTCDVFFNPSIEETFGLVTIEAMACGAPIIGYKSSATPELLEGTANHIVLPHDYNDVVVQIENICNKTKKDYSSNVDICRKRFNKDSQIKKYIDLYFELYKNQALH